MKSKIKKIAIAISVFAISLISSTQVFALSNNLTMNKTTTYYNRYGSDGNNSSWYWTKYNLFLEKWAFILPKRNCNYLSAVLKRVISKTNTATIVN